jgi:hypothetical protein
MPKYVLRETDGQGRHHSEDFEAPTDQSALRRVREEARGQRFELWREGNLVREGTPKRL